MTAGNPYDLTDRELEIVRWLANGHTPKEIAGYHGMSYQTVKSHVWRAKQKMECRSVTEVAVRWVREQEVRDQLTERVVGMLEDALNPTRGDDVTPDPWQEYESRPAVRRGKLPTAKLASAAGTMVVLYVLRQFVDVDTDLEQIVNLVVPLIVAYFVPNAQTPGGAPDAALVVETREIQ